MKSMCASVFVCACDRERGRESGVEKQRSSWRAFVKNNREEQREVE